MKRSSPLIKVLYKSFLKQAQSLDRKASHLYLLQPPSAKEFQLFQSFPTNREYINSLASGMESPESSELLGVLNATQSRRFSGDDLRKVFRDLFRNPTQKESLEGAKIDSAFAMLRYITNQVNINFKSVQSETMGVRIICTPVFDSVNCDPEKEIYPYYYRILFHNLSNNRVQINSRHWIFKSANTEIIVPKFQPGVIGEKPYLVPGATFQYMSSCLLKDPVGTMQGAFLMVNKEDDTAFELDVPICSLSPSNTYET